MANESWTTINPFNLSNTSNVYETFSYDYERFTLKYGLKPTIALRYKLVNTSVNTLLMNVQPIFFSVAYVFVFGAGIFGNIAIFLTMREIQHKRTLTNLFIINLAAADLLVIIFCLPFTLAANIFPGINEM